MSFDPFKGGGDGSSLESPDPLEQAVSRTSRAVNSQTQQQAQAAKQSFVDQLYGNVADSPESLDPTSNPAQALAQTGSASHAAQPQSSGLAPAANPNEQSKLDETRKKLAELQKLHTETYFDVTLGETAQKKRQEREEEEKQLKEQEEEEKRQQEEEEKARMEESLQAFTQHGKGKGPDQLGAPIAVTQAKTTTEINRGTSG